MSVLGQAVPAADIALSALDQLAAEALRVADIARAALRISEIRYRRLFEEAMDGILLINAASGQIEDANPFLVSLLGYSREELLGRKLWEVGAFLDEARNKSMFAELKEREQVRYDDLPLKTKSGLSIDVEFISTVYESDGIKVIQCMIRDISARKRADRAILAQLGQIRQGMMSAVELVTAIAEMRDPYTAGHEKRVAAIAAAIGAHLGFDADRIEGLRVAGYLHDIGKMSIPSEILSKPGKLSVLEMRMVQAHVQAGYDSLSKMAWPWPVAEVALQHHERLDGSGYPNGLSGEAILIEARIMAVADVFEAMSGHRPYRAALGVDRALAEIEQGRGRLYDSDVVDACLHLYRDKAFVPPV